VLEGAGEHGSQGVAINPIAAQIGNIPPAEAEAPCYATQEAIPKAA
jgi:hypothetical protein